MASRSRSDEVQCGCLDGVFVGNTRNVAGILAGWCLWLQTRLPVCILVQCCSALHTKSKVGSGALCMLLPSGCPAWLSSEWTATIYKEERTEHPFGELTGLLRGGPITGMCIIERIWLFFGAVVVLGTLIGMGAFVTRNRCRTCCCTAVKLGELWEMLVPRQCERAPLVSVHRPGVVQQEE